MSYEKRVAEVKDYTLDWAKTLLVNGADTGDTITTSSWTVEAGLTSTAFPDTKTSTTTTIWLSGGTVGVEYTVTNLVVTAQGRQFERSFLLTITAPPAT